MCYKGIRSGQTDGSQCELGRAAAQKSGAWPHPLKAKSNWSLQHVA